MIPFLARSPDETQALGRRLATLLLPGEVVSLTGPLGSGKTCFIQGLCQGLGVEDRVGSPSFILVREHSGKMPVHHVDLYRLQTSRDLDSIGLEDLCDGQGVVVVEWGEKAEGRLAFSCVIRLEPQGESERRIEMSFQDPAREKGLLEGPL